jgi:hypothetical protein
VTRVGRGKINGLVVHPVRCDEQFYNLKHSSESATKPLSPKLYDFPIYLTNSSQVRVRFNRSVKRIRRVQQERRISAIDYCNPSNFHDGDNGNLEIKLSERQMNSFVTQILSSCPKHRISVTRTFVMGLMAIAIAKRGSKILEFSEGEGLFHLH